MVHPDLIQDQAIRRFLRPHRLKRNGRDEFAHVKIMMRDSVDEHSMQNLIHKNWVIRQSITDIQQKEGLRSS